MIATVDRETLAVATFALTAASAAGTCFSVFLKMRLTNQMLEEFQKLRKELALTYQREDVYKSERKDVERRLNRLEGCRGPT